MPARDIVGIPYSASMRPGGDDGDDAHPGRPHERGNVVEAATRLLDEGRSAEALRLLRAPRGSSEDLSIPKRRLVIEALVRLGRDEEAVEELEGLLEAGNEDLLAAAQLADLRVVTGHARDGIAEVQRAIAAARRSDDPGAVARGLLALATACYYRGRIRPAIQAAEEARAVTRSAGTTDPPEGEALLLLAMNTMHADDFGRAEALLDQARLAGPGAVTTEARLSTGFCAFHAGQWDRARRSLSLVLDGRSVPEWLRGLAAGILGVIEVHSDRPEEAALVMERFPAVASPDPRPMQVWATMLSQEAAGALSEAATTAERLVIVTGRLGSPVRYRLYGPDIVRIASAADDPSTATIVTRQLEAVAREADVPSVSAAAQLCRGQLETDVSRLEEAVRLYGLGPRRLDQGQAWRALAAAQSAAAMQADAASSLDRALAIFSHIGAWWDVRLAEADLRHLGRRAGRRGPRTRPSLGWESLTATERRVAWFIASGRTNVEIAQALNVSPRTIETHVTHILGKLDARSRTEAAIVVSRRTGEDRHRLRDQALP